MNKLLGTGMLGAMRPDTFLRVLVLLHHRGPPPAIVYRLAAMRPPDRAAIIDERGTLTFAEAERRTNMLTHALRAAGIDARDTVAIMSRHHRALIEAIAAPSKLAANALLSRPRACSSRDHGGDETRRSSRADLRRGALGAIARCRPGT